MKGSSLLSNSTHDERVVVKFLIKLMKLSENDHNDVEVALAIAREVGVS